MAGGNESHVLLQSWFERSVTHGWSASRILSHAQQMIASIVRLRPGAHLVAMDARAQHFPGGKWRSDARYPPANSSSEPSAACDDAVPEDTWYKTELDWYNTKLSALDALHGVVRIGRCSASRACSTWGMGSIGSPSWVGGLRGASSPAVAVSECGVRRGSHHWPHQVQRFHLKRTRTHFW